MEIDLNKPLKSFIMIRGHRLYLKYEGLHLICYSCGKYCHRSGQCDKVPIVKPTNPIQVVDKTNQAESSNSSQVIPTPPKPNSVEVSSYGTWMIAASRKQGRFQKKSEEFEGCRIWKEGSCLRTFRWK